MREVKKPDFFIVGAPKSGTTSLYFYLKSHPQIFLPRRKELLFFCDDLHFTYPLLNEPQFLEYYKDFRNEKTAGEVSVWNLFSANASKRIKEFNPNAKIIAILRNPVDMLYSLHSNHVFNQNESIADFEEAWNAVADRKAGKKISEVIKCPVQGLYYTEIGKYSQQLQRYYDVFGREKVKVILFEDFKSNTRAVYSDLLNFLGVDGSIIPEFKVYNSSKTIRSSWMRKMTVNAPQWMRKTGRALFPHQTGRRDWLMKTLWKINTKEAERKKASSSIRSVVLNHYRDDINQLQNLIGRDLSIWLREAD
jgi:hypothetical protein